MGNSHYPPSPLSKNQPNNESIDQGVGQRLSNPIIVVVTPPTMPQKPAERKLTGLQDYRRRDPLPSDSASNLVNGLVVRMVVVAMEENGIWFKLFRNQF
jgi:hypothetical protein